MRNEDTQGGRSQAEGERQGAGCGARYVWSVHETATQRGGGGGWLEEAGDTHWGLGSVLTASEAEEADKIHWEMRVQRGEKMAWRWAWRRSCQQTGRKEWAQRQRLGLGNWVEGRGLQGGAPPPVMPKSFKRTPQKHLLHLATRRSPATSLGQSLQHDGCGEPIQQGKYQ